MTYKQIKNLREKEFKRLCGVKPKLFDEMVEVLKQELPQPKQKGGQPKLEVEDQLLTDVTQKLSYENEQEAFGTV
jgi:hypothetical protein